ncbi:RNA-directed DNA polymerase, eukaryota, reverse transcriptase zinc-binding domain protein [Tanacetum coccineum]
MTSPNKPTSKPSRVAKMSVKPIWRKKPNLCNTSNVLNATSPMPKLLTPHYEPSQENNHPNQALPNLYIKDTITSPQVVSHPPFPISPINSHITHTQAPPQSDNQTPYIKDTPTSPQLYHILYFPSYPSTHMLVTLKLHLKVTTKLNTHHLYLQLLDLGDLGANDNQLLLIPKLDRADHSGLEKTFRVAERTKVASDPKEGSIGCWSDYYNGRRYDTRTKPIPRVSDRPGPGPQQSCGVRRTRPRPQQSRGVRSTRLVYTEELRDEGATTAFEGVEAEPHSLLYPDSRCLIFKRRNNLAIRGTIIDGEWIEDPIAVKNEFLSHFRSRFEAPCANVLFFVMVFPTVLQVVEAWKSLFNNGFVIQECNCPLFALILKFQGLIMVDFVMAFDSVRWDFVDDVLKHFREIPYRLSCSFLSWKVCICPSKVVNAGHLQKGVVLDNSLQISLIFYAEDVRLHWTMWDLFSTKFKVAFQMDDEGGMGVSSFFALNRALIFKWIWRFHSQGFSLWSRVIKVIHGVDDKKIYVAGKMAQPSLITSFRRNPRSGTEASQMAMLTSLLEGICLPNMLDRWCWSLSGDEEFSVSSARILIDDKTLGTVGSKMHWCKYVPLKVNILSWRVKLNNLPTRLNLSRRGMDIQSILCPSCNLAVESTNHIFFSCPMMKDLYKSISRWWDVNLLNLSSYDDWWEWFSSLRLSSKLKLLMEGVFYITWWSVWNFRNKSIFGPFPSKARLFDDIVALSFTWCRSRSKLNFSKIDWLKNPLYISM